MFGWSRHNSSPVGSQQLPLQLGKWSSACPACLSALVQEMELCQASEQRTELTVQATPVLQVYFAANHMWTKAVVLEVQRGTWSSCACRDTLSHGLCHTTMHDSVWGSTKPASTCTFDQQPWKAWLAHLISFCGVTLG